MPQPQLLPSRPYKVLFHALEDMTGKVGRLEGLQSFDYVQVQMHSDPNELGFPRPAISVEEQLPATLLQCKLWEGMGRTELWVCSTTVPTANPLSGEGFPSRSKQKVAGRLTLF